MRSGPPYSKSAVCATAPQARSAQAAAASAAVDFMVFLIGFSSIAYVLQEPVRRQFAPQPLAARRLVGHGGHGEKLHTLDIAALRIRDLFARAAAANLAGDHVGETDVVAMPRDLGCAAALAVRFPAGILRAGNVSQPLVGRAELGPSDGCRRSPEPQRAVKPTERRVIRPSADRYDVHAGLQPLSPDNGNGGVGAGRKDIRAPANLPRHDVRPDGAVGGDSQVLQVTVVDDGERRAGLDVREEHQAAVAARARAVFLLRAHAFILALVDDVGFHADGEV